MVDCLTQWIFKPLHSYIFKLLKVVPMDGTHDQLKPIYRLFDQGYTSLYSFDLSSATDRLAVSIQQKLLEELIGVKLSSL